MKYRRNPCSGNKESKMTFRKELKIKTIKNLKQEHFGQVFRQVFFSPETTGNRFLKMAYIDVPPGSTGTAHVHLGEEVVYTIQGKATLSINGYEYLLEAGTCFLIPPDVEHPAKVVGEENWVAVAAYCDECPVLKKAAGKEDIDYPLSAE
jgi:quercetin dioxygenase-like cupin family protein